MCKLGICLVAFLAATNSSTQLIFLNVSLIQVIQRLLRVLDILVYYMATERVGKHDQKVYGMP